MSCRLSKLRRLSSVGLAAVAFSLPLVVGCARGPSQKELGLLDQKRQAVEAAEKKVVELKAEKARLERVVQEKQAKKDSLEKRLETVQSAVANW